MGAKLIKVVMALPFLALPVIAGCAHGSVGVGVGDDHPYVHDYGHREWARPAVVVVHHDVDRHDNGDWHEANERW